MPNEKGTILNLFIKTGNDYSLALNSTDSIYQLMFLGLCITSNYNSYPVYLYRMIKTIMLRIYRTVKA